jgi:hypothetical protein
MAGSSRFSVQAPSSTIAFTMEAPFEKIYGEAPGAIEGFIDLDPHEVSKSRGVIKMDLGKLYLFQQKRDDESTEYGEKVKSPRQNDHMKQWFGIDDSVPAAQREQNRWAVFSVNDIRSASANDIGQVSGSTKKLTATVSGELSLHGRTARKSVKVELTVTTSGDRVESLAVKSLEPLRIALKAHDIRPPDANTSEQALQSWLGLFGKKVAEEAPVNFEFSAR